MLSTTIPTPNRIILLACLWPRTTPEARHNESPDNQNVKRFW
jgi:hypothetical protein